MTSERASQGLSSTRPLGQHRRPGRLFVGYNERLRILPTPFIRWWAFAAMAVVVLVPFVASGFIIHLFNLTWIAVMGAIAINLLTGLAGLVSLGHAAFLAVGAFTAAELASSWGMPAWLTLIGAGLAGGLVGLLIGLPSLRLKALYVAVTTFALHYAVVLGATVWQGRAAAYAGITMPTPVLLGGAELRSPFSWYFPLLVMALAAMLLFANLRRTRLGRAWIALHDREVAAEMLGINLVSAKVLVFVLSSAVTGVVGAVAGYYSGVVSSESYTIGLAISYLAMIIIGGLGRVLGAVLGAFFVTWLPFFVEEATRLTGLEVGPGKIGGLQTAAFAVVIIIFILYEPGGLAAIWDRLRNFVALWPFRVLPLQQSRR